jgi:hypothetical protein
LIVNEASATATATVFKQVVRLTRAIASTLRLAGCQRSVGEGIRLLSVSESLDHGHEPRAEEIALHQRFLTLLGQIEAATSEGDEREVARLRPLLDRARKRWLAANMRVTRGD